MIKDGFFLAKSSNAFALQIQDEDLKDFVTLHHEDDTTKILYGLDSLGGHVVGEISIPDEIDSEEEEQE
jgi:hypothetical protein